MMVRVETSIFSESSSESPNSSPDNTRDGGGGAASDFYPSTSGVDIKFRPPRKAPIGGKWTEHEDQRLREIVQVHGAKNWKRLASILGNVRSDVQCLHRWNKVLRPGLSKGPWTADEDKIVKEMVLKHGAGNIKWSVIAAQLPGRIGKQCRERWFNHLDPEIKKGDWSTEEDDILFETQRIHGNRWSEIAKLLPGRTENAVKNRWNSSARKRWLRDNGLTEANLLPPKGGVGASSSTTSSGGNGKKKSTRGDLHQLATGSGAAAKSIAPAPSPSVIIPKPSFIDDCGGHPRYQSMPAGNLDRSTDSLMMSSTLLDQNGGLLGGIGVNDSVDILNAFDEDNGNEQETRRGVANLLRASDEMDFSNAVDYLSTMDHYPGSDLKQQSTQPDPPSTMEQQRRDVHQSDLSSFMPPPPPSRLNAAAAAASTAAAAAKKSGASTTTPNAFENSGLHKSPPTQQHAAASGSGTIPCPPSNDIATMVSSFDTGLRAALNGTAMPSSSSSVIPGSCSKQTDVSIDADFHGSGGEVRISPQVLPEELQRAATVAVERIVAESSEREVPITMLPYFHFLNERGKQSIMNQLIAQFSQTSISSNDKQKIPFF